MPENIKKISDLAKEVPTKYRPIPFWSWNEKLSTDETVRQTKLMHDVGIGGYFMHARGGLQTEFMGDEWFENVDAAIKSGKELGMEAWAYDENGWPSGFGGGAVNGKGEKYQQKYLRCREGEDDGEHSIANVGGYHFYYDINPFYVDTLDGEVIADFINEIYEKYYDRFGSNFEGFFTDEPQISRNGIPWSLTLPSEYKKAYNDELIPHLPELFFKIGDFETTRFRFWKLITDLFSKNYMKQIYDWCEAHNLKYTGHLVLEENFHSQLTSNGACMPHYEYFHKPGMDWLCRVIYPCLTMLQVASVAHQLNKPQILSETFALCGHNVGHDELKGIYEWQMVRGINQLCQHLEGYSLRGIRKRDYPPAMYYQQPWWDDYKLFNDAMSRTGMLLADGKVKFDTLLLHTQTSAWICYDNASNEGLNEYNRILMQEIEKLEAKHVLFHLGDETIMERHAYVDGAAIVIGTQRYTQIIVPRHIKLFENTERLLDEYRKNGGIITTADDIPANEVIDNPHITYTKRVFDDFDMHYFVNTSTEERASKINIGNLMLDPVTGELHPFDGYYNFRAYDSIIVIDDHSSVRPEHVEAPSLKTLPLDGEWKVMESSLNSITLDHCDYYFDGELIQNNAYVLNVQNRACALERPVDIRCDFKANFDFIPSDLYLVCETPDIFEIKINGKNLVKKDCGYFRDSAFRMLDISGMVTKGENIITLLCRFSQPDHVYENLRKARIFESELNKLSYGMEIEAIYLAGNFGVKCDGSFETLERKAERFTGEFIISNPPTKLSLINIERQGFPFFSGKLTLQKTFNLDSTNYCINFKKFGVNVLKLKINGEEVKTFLWEPYFANLSNYLQKGENTVELEITNNLRNLLGPHHLPEGESYAVGPGSFFHEPCVFNGNPPAETNGYCFTEITVSER